MPAGGIAQLSSCTDWSFGVWNATIVTTGKEMMLLNCIS